MSTGCRDFRHWGALLLYQLPQTSHTNLNARQQNVRKFDLFRKQARKFRNYFEINCGAF